MSILKKIKKAAESKTAKDVGNTAGDVGLEIAMTTPVGEVVGAAIAENEQEQDKK